MSWRSPSAVRPRRRRRRRRRRATSAVSLRRSRASRRGGGDEAPASDAVRPGRFPPRMLTYIFVLFWVLLGLGILFVALSGGPGGAGSRLMSTGRGARRAAVVLFVIAVAALGFGVPAAVIAAVSGNDSIPEANVSDL